ncbi:hypothetical protein K1T71_000002 [Dendrolimus kikuchii]|uniref:Uncharacterized protein n=1 Tax=Dendrolimus kikuchii TaxID=765133 RepID=A0ACC1DIL0_9NEOP|nr:hypothetical protein K1T71_000002 [Dendrolimus kikuchii]
MPRTRQGAAASSDAEEEENQSVTMSQEMFSNLITSLQKSQQEFCSQLLKEVRASTPDPSIFFSDVAIQRCGNFTQCTARFTGSPDESVENFLDAVNVYKSCLKVSDEDASKGLSMLLTDSAAVWWQGVKSTTTSWTEAVTRLRSAYGMRRPPHRVYTELFALSQGDENTDLFIAKVRALLAKLPVGDLCERVELDMTFGLLDRRIRKRVDRESICTFEDLLRKARSIEDSLAEVRQASSTSAVASSPPLHAEARLSGLTRNVPGQSDTTASSNLNGKPSRLFCVYCKRRGHTKDTCEKLLSVKNEKGDKVPLKCYGCGALGVIRSKCVKCNPKESMNPNSSAFYSVETDAITSCKCDVERKSGPPRFYESPRPRRSFDAPTPTNPCDMPPRSVCTDLTNFCKNKKFNNVSNFVPISVCPTVDDDFCTCLASKVCKCKCNRNVVLSDSQTFSDKVGSTQSFSANSSVNRDSNSQTLFQEASGYQPLRFNPVCLSNNEQPLRPVLNISILGEHGVGLADSAAKSSIAGHTLYKILKQKAQPFYAVTKVVKLADGLSKTMDLLATEVEVTLEYKTKLVRFLILPNATSNETLLGIDFLKLFNLNVDFGRSTWTFSENKSRVFPLRFENESPGLSCMSLGALRDDEATSLNPRQRTEISRVIKGYEDVLTPGGDPTPYAEHKIDTVGHAPIAVSPYRLMPAKNGIMPENHLPLRPVLSKRNRGRPPKAEVRSVRAQEKCFSPALEGEDVAASRLPKRYNRGKPPLRYSPPAPHLRRPSSSDS